VAVETDGNSNADQEQQDDGPGVWLRRKRSTVKQSAKIVEIDDNGDEIVDHETINVEK
jgi:hypothetical protein